LSTNQRGPMSIQRTSGASRYAQVLAARASSSNTDKYGVVGAAAIGVTDAVAQGAKSLGNGIKVVAQATVSLENAAKSVVTGSLSSAKAIASYASSAAGAVASTISKLV
jgi:predicted homoserine dehydrogenase-like protein